MFFVLFFLPLFALSFPGFSCCDVFIDCFFQPAHLCLTLSSASASAPPPPPLPLPPPALSPQRSSASESGVCSWTEHP